MILYDKLKNMETEEKFFDFTCPNCKADGLKKGVFNIRPIGISWKPDMIDNSDIKNPILRKGYDSLPTKREALLKFCINNGKIDNINIKCNSCNEELSIFEPIKDSDIRKWCNKNIDEYLDLRKKE